MSSDEDAVARFGGGTQYYDEHSNNNALDAYIRSHRSTQYGNTQYDNFSSSSDSKYGSDRDEVSSIGTLNKDDPDDEKRPLNVFNPSTRPEDQSLLQKDAKKDMHGRLLREKVMRNHKYSALRGVHIWTIVVVTSLNHLLRKLYEYFAFPIALYFGVSFHQMGWSVAALDFAAILSSTVLLPFVITRAPHLIQFVCQLVIGLSILFMVWWHTFAGLFVMRFLFGIGYILILSNWSACISSFLSPSKHSSAIGRIDLSWAFASFFFVLCAYIMDNYGLNYIFYILGVLAIIASFVLFSIMPSQKMIRSEVHPQNCVSSAWSMVRLIFCRHIPTATFLVVIGMVTLINSMLTLLLAPWLITDYDLTVTEFGYCSIIIGTAQVVAIIFSYQFGNKLGVGWSLVAGILVQGLMFVLIYLLGSGGLLWEMIVSSKVLGDSGHYTFPLLFILLILAIHFIAAEFTYINAVSCMLHIAPIGLVGSRTVAANAMKFVTSCCRIGGAVAAPFLWYAGYEGGSFELFSLIAMVVLGTAFLIDLVLMLYIACFVWDKEKEDEEFMMVSSNGERHSLGFSDSDSDRLSASAYMFQHDAGYGVRSEDEMDDEYIAKILSTNMEFTFV